MTKWERAELIALAQKEVLEVTNAIETQEFQKQNT